MLKVKCNYIVAIFLVQAQDGHNNTLFLQLSRDGEYWNVNSAGVFKKSYGNSKKNIWSASEVQSGNSAVAIDGSQSKPNADEGSTSNGTPSNISESKDTTTELITQEIEQENLHPPQSTAEEQVEVSAVENEDADEQILKFKLRKSLLRCCS